MRTIKELLDQTNKLPNDIALCVSSEEFAMMKNHAYNMNAFAIDTTLDLPVKPVQAIGADEALLRDALAAVTGERRKAYGDPENNFKLIAELFGSYLGHRRIRGGLADGVSGQLSLNDNIKPSDVAVLMILVKVARLAQTPGHRDSLLDIAGYAACGARC